MSSAASNFLQTSLTPSLLPGRSLLEWSFPSINHTMFLKPQQTPLLQVWCSHPLPSLCKFCNLISAPHLPLLSNLLLKKYGRFSFSVSTMSHTPPHQQVCAQHAFSSRKSPKTSPTPLCLANSLFECVWYILKYTVSDPEDTSHALPPWHLASPRSSPYCTQLIITVIPVHT